MAFKETLITFFFFFFTKLLMFGKMIDVMHSIEIVKFFKKMLMG